ncbi:MAG: hypothetical protein K6T27_09265 [Thermoleophilum sp.]|nr:hypothetical protein [Thermoleophilum sp.]
MAWALSEFAARYDGFIVDLDGCMWVGEEPIAGSSDAVAALREHGRRVVFATNDPRRSPEEYVRKLWRQGVRVAASDVVTVGQALERFLATEHPGRSAYVVGSDALRRHVPRCDRAHNAAVAHRVERARHGDGDRALDTSPPPGGHGVDLVQQHVPAREDDPSAQVGDVHGPREDPAQVRDRLAHAADKRQVSVAQALREHGQGVALRTRGHEQRQVGVGREVEAEAVEQQGPRCGRQRQRVEHVPSPHRPGDDLCDEAPRSDNPEDVTHAAEGHRASFVVAAALPSAAAPHECRRQDAPLAGAPSDTTGIWVRRTALPRRAVRLRVSVLEQPLASVEPLGDAVGLTLRAHGRRVRGQVAGRGDEHVDRRLGRRAARPHRRVAAQAGELPPGGLDHLDGVEVAVLAQQQPAERRQ